MSKLACLTRCLEQPAELRVVVGAAALFHGAVLVEAQLSEPQVSFRVPVGAARDCATQSGSV